MDFDLIAITNHWCCGCTQKMAEEVTNNLVYLKEKLTNLPSVLNHCVENGIITLDEKAHIMAGGTSNDKNGLLFDALKMNWEEVNVKFIKILRQTSNKHCAKKIIWTSNNQANDACLELPNLEERKSILGSKWWPDEKHLPRAFLQRQENDSKLIDILKEYLTKKENRSAVINQGAAVSGMGGVGKTTIAKWFAIHFQDSYDHIIWIDCGEENLSTCFMELARELEVDASLGIHILSKKCFSKLAKVKCLFIFDNAECYQGHQGIRGVLPKHDNFHTIITSRSKEWGKESGDGKIPELHLNAFPTEDSVEFLSKNLQDELYTEDELKELSDLLGNLPLALQIAVTTINTKKLSLTSYLERVKQTSHIINKNFDDYERTINKTMKISLDIIKAHEEDPKQAAYKILLVLGYIKPDSVKVRLFQSIENLSEDETGEALELLEKYSLITLEFDYTIPRRIGVHPRKIMTSCSIHRLLQQVIRHNGKENEKTTIIKILSVKGFHDFKLLPYQYADDETRKLFPNVKAVVIDQNKLEELFKQKKFSEALIVSKMIRDDLKKSVAKYNHAVCLEKKDELTKAKSVLESLHNSLVSRKKNKKINESMYSNISNFLRGLGVSNLKYVGENEIFNLTKTIEPYVVRGLMFLVYNRLGMSDAVYEIMNQYGELANFGTSQFLDYLMKFLKSPSIVNYRVEYKKNIIVVKVGNDGENIISLKNFSLSEDFPNEVHHLSLIDVEMLDAEGLHLDSYAISNSISNCLKSLTIKCAKSTKFAIGIHENLQSCLSIILEDCILLIPYNYGKEITPTKIDVRRVSFMQNEEEIENICLSDFIDFHQCKTITLHGGNMNIKLGESLSIDQIFLRDFNSLDLNDFNCTVNILNIEHTCVPLLAKNIALRVNKLLLKDCSVHMMTLFFLSQTAKTMELASVTIEIDEACLEKPMGICTTDVKFSNVKLIQDSVEVDGILNNTILDLSKIKRLSVRFTEDTTMVLDLNQQFSLDYLEVEGIKLLANLEKSTSSAKILVFLRTDIRGIILESQFRVTEAIKISSSVVEITSLNNILAVTNKVIIEGSSIHFASFDSNDPSPKFDDIKSKVKEVEIYESTFFKNGKEIQDVLPNEFANISQLKSLTLDFGLNMENMSLSLDNISLQGPVLNWDKGKGNFDKVELSGIPFIEKNYMKFNSLVFEKAVIDLSCIPENIQRIELKLSAAVTCSAQVGFNDLNCVILESEPSQLEKYFSHCLNLVKVELGYTVKEEILDLQWLPKSIKRLKLKLHPSIRIRWPLTIMGTGDCQFQLDTLIFENFRLPISESALEVLQPENIVISYPGLKTAHVDHIIKLVESFKSVAIGKFEWTKDKYPQSYPISQFVDQEEQFYIFENQKGRVLQQAEFDEITKI